MPEATLQGETIMNGVTLEQYTVDMDTPCPIDECPGHVRYKGLALVHPEEMVCHLIGVPCDFCDKEFMLEFKLEPCGCNGETYH